VVTEAVEEVAEEDSVTVEVEVVAVDEVLLVEAPEPVESSSPPGRRSLSTKQLASPFALSFPLSFVVL
jgi:hypothetical protein